MTAKKRILKFLKYKGVSQYEFSRRTGLSNGFLNSGDNINSANLDVITNVFRDVNLIWLVKGIGPMLNMPDGSDSGQQQEKPNIPAVNQEYIGWILEDSDEKLQPTSNSQLYDMNVLAKKLIWAKNETIKSKDEKIEVLEKLLAEKEKIDELKDRIIKDLDSKIHHQV